MREFLKGLELDRETIDTIMAEYGKNVQGLREQVDEYKTKASDYYDQVRELTEANENNKKIQEELNTYKQKQEDDILNDNINKVLGNKKFTSEYARAGLINDIKSELKKDENNGLGVQDIFNNLVKDRTDIFANPNQIQDMEGMGDTDTNVSKEIFDKMTYAQRIEFKQNNPELFEKYNV